ncbi:AAA domain-containing protein [Sutcliffiella horikoshii]|uniref:AAA domain-containing protein n=1 Tax=Sutcliffiella horikoshii TaxID=79883 RepID=A0A5D4SWC9_9BACI|nr:AAA family ATPase [Sutcliffiella horikoshii]TYS67605.1 AAA domain-containing protein [Sutcliffiella horikoshii]
MNKVWENDLVGVLADVDQSELLYRDSILINKQDSLQFFVRIISQPAESFPNVKAVTGFYSDLEKWGFEDDYTQPEFIRKEKLREWLDDRLLIFKVEKRIRYNHEEVYNMFGVRVMPKLPSYEKDIKLMPIPIFSQKVNGMEQNVFISRLVEKKFVGRITEVSHEANDTPQIILWREETEEDEQFTVYGVFEKHQYAHGGFNFELRDELKGLALEEEWLDECYLTDESPNVAFVPITLFQKLLHRLEEQEAVQVADVSDREKTLKDEVSGGASSIDKQTSPEIQSSRQEVAVSVMEKPISEISVPVPKGNEKEQEFLELLFSHTQDAGLIYRKENLINFHTSMKSSSLVILSGMSGTGKTKLVELYSHSLGLKGEQLTVIPVSPSWTSDSDLIGYADTLNMVYRPGDSGLINALRKAEDDKDKLYIICFDEMNLARVEHYFSQFLSILEMDHGKRVLRLYNDDLESRLYNSAQYPPTIVIRENVLFVGTVNMDESTYHFSDKVLDRANVLSLDVMPFTEMKQLPEKKKGMVARADEVDYDTFESFQYKNRSLSLHDDELGLLWEVHQMMQSVNKQVGVGPRIVKQIDQYLGNLPAQEYILREDAFDLQVVQRVLTKVRGSEDQLRDLLGRYNREKDTVEGSLIIRLFDRYTNISIFKESRNVIKQKAKELKYNGYTM